MTIEHTGSLSEWLRKTISKLKSHLAELGYSESTILRLDATWKELIVYCEAYQATEFTVDLERRFVWERYSADLGDRDISQNVSRAIHMLDDYLQYGMVFKQSSITLKGFSPAYKELFEGFLDSLRQNQVAEGSIRTWRSRLFRFEYFLLESGIEHFHLLELHHVNTYIESLTGFSPGTVAATIRILGKLFDYALAKGYHYISYANALPCIRRTHKYRLPTVFSPDEVECILAQVDRSNPLGKRNYAILLLVTRLGLRISDVRLLRFENIDWKNKRISIHQQKTGIPLELPLLEDVGWAIIDYFFEYLPSERGLSQETIQSYRDAMSLLLDFCERERKIRRDRLEVSDFNRELIDAFFRWLEQEKGNSITTRNQRRAAINAFFKFLQYEDPGFVLLCQQIREIPPKKCEQRVVPHLSEEAIQTIFGQPNLTTREGRRDFAFLTLIYESAARASEIANLRFGDIRFDKKWAVVHLKGKGRKFRDIPVLPVPAKILKDYLAEESQYRQCDIDAPLFCNRSKAPLTRGGVYYIIQKYVSLAQKEKPDLFPVRVHPHVFRHSRAMHWLEAGVDLQYIKDLLGHSDIKTTEVYARLNIKMKQKLLEQVHPQQLSDQQPSWTDDENLMQWLTQLYIPTK